MSDPIIDTICALSTPGGRAALGVIRISGPKAFDVIQEMTGHLPGVRLSEVLVLRNRSGDVLDEAVITLFKGPKSFTGEDIAEISGHGNPEILNSIIQEIVSRETIRIAEPGEFLRRALANGKVTLDQVEALNWALNSTSIEGARLGVRAKIEGLGGAVNTVSEEIQHIICDLQAELDFQESEVGSVDLPRLIDKLEEIKTNLIRWVKSFDLNKYLFNKFVIVLAGPPNSGKSSLFNTLIGQTKAIIYDQPGTTRDPVEHSMEMGGIPVTIIDSAGIHHSSDPIERMGIEKTFRAMELADLIIWVNDKADEPGRDLFHKFKSKNWIFVRSKADLSETAVLRNNWISTSAVTGDGIKELMESVLLSDQKILKDGSNDDAGAPLVFLTSERQKGLIQNAIRNIDRCLSMLREGDYLDLATDPLIKASKDLEGIVGEIPTEEVLERIFSRFCIGK